MMKDQKSCIFRLKNEMQIQTCFLSASLTLSLLQSDLRNNWQICQNFPAPSCKKKLPHLNIPQFDQCGSSLLFLRQILLFQCDLPEVFLSFFQDNVIFRKFFFPFFRTIPSPWSFSPGTRCLISVIFSPSMATPPCSMALLASERDPARPLL